MRLKWTTSTAADFSSYRVVLSTDPNAVNNYFVGAGVSGHGETKVFDIYTKIYKNKFLQYSPISIIMNYKHIDLFMHH